MKARRPEVVTAVAVALSASGVTQAALYDRGGGLIYDDVLKVTWLQNANYAATELTDARRDAIISAVNAAAPSWLSGHTMAASDFSRRGASYTGTMSWWGAMAWADELVYAGLDDWRLPVMVFPSPGNAAFSNNGTTAGGYGATGSGWGPAEDSDGLWSEFGWMWYHNLGNRGHCTPNGEGSSTSCVEQSGSGLVDGLSNPNDETLFGGTIQSFYYWSGTEYAPYPGYAWVFYAASGGQGNSNKDFSCYAWPVRPGDVPLPGAGLLFLSALAGLGWARRGR